MGNMQSPSAKKALSHSLLCGWHRDVLTKVLAVLLAAGALLLLPGCRNLLRPSDSDGGGTEPGSGILLLTIHGQGVGRTIRPDITLASFDRFDLRFVDAYNASYYFYVEDWDLGEVQIYVGTWDLYVTAFLYDGTNYLEAARGGLEYIEVIEGATVDGDIELSPIGVGYGTFSWQISFLYGVMADIYSARMEIWDGAIGGTLRETIVFISGGVSDEPLSGSRSSMPAGQYFVVFELINDQGERAGVNEALHVFHNMESHVEWDFTPGDFPVTLLNFILGSWIDNQWNFVGRGINERHFSFLGINGVSVGNFNDTDNTGIIWWFNELSYEFSPPTDMPGLVALVDIALIGIGGITANNQSAAQTAITGLVMNGSIPGFAWSADTLTVTVTIGAYSIQITFPPWPTGEGDFDISFADFFDIEAGPSSLTVHLVNGPDRPTSVNITVDDPGQYDPYSIRWFLEGVEITETTHPHPGVISGGYGEILTVDSNLHNNFIRTHRVTVVVRKEGVPFSKVIDITVSP